jgi:hypothetical protein
MNRCVICGHDGPVHYDSPRIPGRGHVAGWYCNDPYACLQRHREQTGDCWAWGQCYNQAEYGCPVGCVAYAVRPAAMGKVGAA